MSYKKHMRGYDDPRTFYNTDSLYCFDHGIRFPPVIVELSPTCVCNQKCRFCYTNGREDTVGNLRDDILYGCFDQFVRSGVKSVMIQGTGEPFMHKCLADSLANVDGSKLAIGLTTNGSLLSEAIQEKILKNLFYIKFSVLDYDPKRYAFVHGCPESQHKNVIDNLKTAIRLRDEMNLGVALWASVYIDEINFNYVYDICQFFKDIGLDYVIVQEATYTKFSPVSSRACISSSCPTASTDNLKVKISSIEDSNFKVKTRFPINNESFSVGVTRSIWKENECSGLKFYMVVASNGEVYPCWRAWGKKELSYGSLYKSSFEEILKSDRRADIDRLINITPPTGDECTVCNHSKLNRILNTYKHDLTPWRYFL